MYKANNKISKKIPIKISARTPMKMIQCYNCCQKLGENFYEIIKNIAVKIVQKKVLINFIH